VSTPELSVVCRSCGAEVSPYVTECPYCGARLRKRAPKLEREGDEIKVREGARDRRRRRAAERRAARAERSFSFAEGRPYATVAAILAPALLFVLTRADALSISEAGLIVDPVDDEWWRYLAAPFVYDDMGYLFACGLAFAIFVPGVERRIGTIPTGLLLVACGALGMLSAEGLDTALGDGDPFAGGGNGIALGALAAWAVMRDAERRADPTEEDDRIALTVATIVLLALPLVEDTADVWAGLAGAAIGAACGLAAALGRREAA
jgi:membrane associated rhomboid family serine protease